MPVMPQAQGAPVPTPPPAGPMGSSMAQPTPNDGSRQMAMVQVETAQQMLEQAMPALGADSDEYKAVERAMKALAKNFKRSQASGLVPAQIAEMARAQQQSPLTQFMGGAGGAQPPQPAQPQPGAMQ